jgi:cysteinyl-tRNA synthetase
VTLDQEKMSKSLGNFFTIREVLKKFEPEALRFFLLGTHYRSPINFSDVGLAEAERRLDYFYETLQKADEVAHGATAPGVNWPFLDELDRALDDDFNTPEALAALSAPFAKLNELSAKPAKGAAAEIAALCSALRAGTEVLGICQQPPSQYLRKRYARMVAARGLDEAKIDGLIQARGDARKAKDYARADALRKELLDLGIEIKDTAAGTTWKPVS